MRIRSAFRCGSTTPVTPPALRRTLLLFSSPALACSALLLGGCIVFLGGFTEYPPPPATIVASVDCERSVSDASSSPGSPPSADPLAGSVPAGFVPVQLVECFLPERVADAAGQAAKVLWPVDVWGVSKPELTTALNGLTLGGTKS
ncbi:hypothetical protein ACX80E_11215 [Arthrobacter sp. TMN-49]